MSLQPALEPNEEIVFEDGYSGDRYVPPFRFAVSNQAVHVTKEKHFAREAWYLDRIPLLAVRQVLLERQRGIGTWVAAVLLFSGGMVMATVMIYDIYVSLPGTRVSGVPFAMIAAGILIPFFARGRLILVVQLHDGIYKWKPQLRMDSKTKSLARRVQIDFIKACRGVGLHVFDDKQNGSY